MSKNGTTYYVNINAPESGDGSQSRPFQHIQQAADIAVAGDEVVVAPGVYRESVDPKNAGSADAPIVYRSEQPLGATITGAEKLTGWSKTSDGIWSARVSNSIFTDRNPYTTLVSGDWFIAAFKAHTGELYINDKALFEVTELEQVVDPVPSKMAWDTSFSTYTWYCEQDENTDETVFYANFHEYDPNEEEVEINVRKSCFYPSEEGVGYITLDGFNVTKAATQWAPPTAYQEGMVGPHWSKGWVIENCEISHSKCSGISLGKYLQPNNDNKWLNWKYKDGTQTERDCICQAANEGWSKETVGSHLIRHCNIHDCGQTGIVGHMGGVFSVIEDNHIHHINNRRNLAGAEIGGIKMHAAIDVTIRHNHIHNCTRGLWLDWQAQGTRVSGNLFHDNTLAYDFDPSNEMLGDFGEDIFVEVSHGPTLIDNNVLLSERSLKLCTQGVAIVHNLIAGSLNSVSVGTNNGAKTLTSPRYTPYHQIHGTLVCGFMTILHGDTRVYNNIFANAARREAIKILAENTKDHPNDWDDLNFEVGTKPYEDYPTFEEWDKQFEGYCGMGAGPSNKYYDHLPVWTGGNLFLGGAEHCSREKDFTDVPSKISLKLVEKDGKWSLKSDLFDYVKSGKSELINTEKLGMAFEPEEKFENIDGTPITFDVDFFGKKRNDIVPGPFAMAADGEHELFQDF